MPTTVVINVAQRACPGPIPGVKVVKVVMGGRKHIHQEEGGGGYTPGWVERYL